MSHNPTVVICHGFYHTPAPYQTLIEVLSSQSIDALCPQLPTSDLHKLNVGDVNNPNFDREPPAGGYPQGEEDTKALLAVLKPLIEAEGKSVLLLAHSAGGWVATQAAVLELQAKTRQAKGLHGGILGILYYGAFIIPVHESIHSFFQPKDGPVRTPPWLRFHKHGRDGLATLISPETYLFNDLEPEAAAKWSATLTASPIVKTKLTNDAYSSLPCGYLVLENDQMLPKAYQEAIIALQSQKTGDFKIYHCPAGHSPHLSWTEGMADTVQDFLKGL